MNQQSESHETKNYEKTVGCCRSNGLFNLIKDTRFAVATQKMPEGQGDDPV